MKTSARIILIVFILFCGVISVFSASVPLVKYYNSSLESHACDPGSMLCAYAQIVSIDDSNLINCTSGGTKILGLSDPTNAHVEILGQTTYSNNICMQTSLVSGSGQMCGYTLPNQSCDANLVGSVCLFEVSGVTNAHLSSCGVFGSSGIKFCCAANIVPVQVINGACGDANNFTYASTVGGPPIPDLCLSGDANFSPINFPVSNTVSWKCNGRNGGFPSSDCIAYRSAGGVVGPTPEGRDCNIRYFNVEQSIQNDSTKVSYECYANNTDVNIVFFDNLGNIVYPLTGGSILLKDANACGILKKEIVLGFGPTDPRLIYQARLFTGTKCKMDSFFSITPKNEFTIPDGNGIVAILVCVIVLGIIISRSKVNKERKS